MNVADYLILFLISGIIFLAFDLLWLGVIAKDLYKKHLGHYMAKNPNVAYAAVFYVLFLVGIMFFATVPAVNEGSLGIAMGRGAAYGFFTYATWGLTNAAVFKKWPNNMVPIDLAWGTFLSFVVASSSYSIFTGIIS